MESGTTNDVCLAENSDINSNNKMLERNSSEENINTSCENGELNAKKRVEIQVNNASGDHKCNHCREYFENPILLLRHKREVHNFPRTLLPIEDIEKYYDYPNRTFCPICKKVIKTNNFRSVFIKHLHTHTPMLVFECIICKKKFRRKDHMINHQKRHVVPMEDFIKKKNS